MNLGLSANDRGLRTVDSGLHVVDPCEYLGWDDLLSGRPDAGIFHTSGWARVLRDTYGHRPFYFCRLEEGCLAELLPVMEVRSRLTGKRGVSLPFTDSVLVLQSEGRGEKPLYDAAVNVGRERGWRYLECRGDNSESGWGGSASSVSFYSHTIDLTCGAETLFKGLESSVRRGIRKAEQKKLTVECDSTIEGVKAYYQLHCGTRRRHGAPPQPFRFFENIAHYVLGQGHGLVGIARLEAQPIAAAVFFHFGREAVYKFGASDLNFQHLRPNNLLMWEAIKRLAGQGLAALQMGRTSLGNEGLRRFKLGFGARETELSYSKYDFRKAAFVQDVDRAETWMNNVLRLLPGRLFRLAGALLYPHLS